MQIMVERGVVRAQAETMEDIQVLLSKASIKPNEHVCWNDGLSFKTAKGLSIHMTKMHQEPVPSPLK